jgi:hypothetical protein
VREWCESLYIKATSILARPPFHINLFQHCATVFFSEAKRQEKDQIAQPQNASQASKPLETQKRKRFTWPFRFSAGGVLHAILLDSSSKRTRTAKPRKSQNLLGMKKGPWSFHFIPSTMCLLLLSFLGVSQSPLLLALSVALTSAFSSSEKTSWRARTA